MTNFPGFFFTGKMLPGGGAIRRGEKGTRSCAGTPYSRSWDPSPGITASMRTALADLRLSRLFVVHSGTMRYPLGERAEAVPLKDLAKVF